MARAPSDALRALAGGHRGQAGGFLTRTTGLSRYDGYAFFADPHPPYQYEPAIRAWCAFLRFFRPARVYLLGDFVDFYQLSRFDKNPSRALELQADLDCAHALLKRLRSAAPDAAMWLIKGNHEDRLRRYLWTRAAELSKLRGVTVTKLLELDKLKIRYVESGQTRVGDFVIKHGTLVRSRAGYTATGEMDRAGLSGISGHSHRLGQPYKRTMAGSGTWLEAGCGCDLNPEYLEGGVADWQHALAYGWFERGGNRFVCHGLPIINGRVIYGGQEIAG